MAPPSSEPVLPKGSLILVTGVSGYIGAHTANEALNAGYKVRGTSRSEEKGEKTKAVFTNHPDYSVAVVPSFSDGDAFQKAMEGCDAVIHIASDTSFGFDPNVVVTGSVSGVNLALRAAAKTPSVKRFVLTSSSVSVLFPQPGVDITVDETTWNEEALKIAWAPPPYKEERAYPVYAASKVEGEKALWKFMQEEKPQFVANAVLPNFNMGKILTTGSVTGQGIIDAYNGKASIFPSRECLPPLALWMRLNIFCRVHDRRCRLRTASHYCRSHGRLP